MLHRLTIGHLDPAAVECRQTVPTKALDMDVVHRHLRDLGERDADGAMTLGGCKVQFENGAVRCLWKGGRTNRLAEEFALRVQKDTGCLSRRGRLSGHRARRARGFERSGAWGGFRRCPGPLIAVSLG